MHKCFERGPACSHIQGIITPLKKAHRPAGSAAVGAGAWQRNWRQFSLEGWLIPWLSCLSHVSWGYFPPLSGTAGEALLKLGSAGAAHYREVGVSAWGLYMPAQLPGCLWSAVWRTSLRDLPLKEPHCGLPASAAERRPLPEEQRKSIAKLQKQVS